jgi:hypothetical protein
MSSNWFRLFFIEFFKGLSDINWRVATPNKGPRRVPSLLSLILDMIKHPKKD